jgi:hypothetical protein
VEDSEGVECASMSFRAKLAQSIYNYLAIGEPPHPADCIVVMAGKQERKSCGVELWRSGCSPRLMLSVGRFEWRKFRELKLDSDGGLVSLVKDIPPVQRHFLVLMDHQETRCFPVRVGFPGTKTEVEAIARFLEGMSLNSLLVVSSPAHLRRVALAFRHTLRKSGIRLTFVAASESLSFEDPAIRSAVWKEYGKYLFYRLLFI